MSNNNDLQAFNNIRAMIWFFAGVCVAFLLFMEYTEARDSYIQSALEAEYEYDYACSPSSQIVKKAEFGRNVYLSTALYVNCGVSEEGLGNFMRPSHVIKKYAVPNAPALLTI